MPAWCVNLASGESGTPGPMPARECLLLYASSQSAGSTQVGRQDFYHEAEPGREINFTRFASDDYRRTNL